MSSQRESATVTPFLILAAAAVPPVSAHDLFAHAFEVPARLYSRAIIPSGATSCDRAAKARQNKAFDSRFGTRFNRLLIAIRTRDGLENREPDEVNVSSCVIAKRAAKAKSLDQFDRDLQNLEAAYGLCQSPLTPPRIGHSPVRNRSMPMSLGAEDKTGARVEPGTRPG